MDDIIAITKEGKFRVSKIAEKTFMGKDLLYVGIYNKNDEHMVYNMIYVDGKTGVSMAKRFSVNGVTRDKEYDLTKGNKGSKVHYLTANPNSESEVVTITLSPASTARVKSLDYDFAELMIKGKGSQGNTVTKYPVKKVVQKSLGDSTLGGREIYYDEVIGRLNTESRGRYLGSFNTDDTILVLSKDGTYELTSFDLTNHYDVVNLEIIEKFDPERVVTAIHYDGESKTYYVKRFRIETRTTGKRFSYLNESKGSKLMAVSTGAEPMAEIKFQKDKKGDKQEEVLSLSAFIDVKGWKAMGNKLNYFKVHSIQLLKSGEEELKPVPPVKGAKKVPKPIPVTLPAEAEKLLNSGETFSLEISTSEGEEEKPQKEKRQLNLF
jgi:topoisomerase-4 subunit A